MQANLATLRVLLISHFDDKFALCSLGMNDIVVDLLNLLEAVHLQHIHCELSLHQLLAISPRLTLLTTGFTHPDSIPATIAAPIFFQS